MSIMSEEEILEGLDFEPEYPCENSRCAERHGGTTQVANWVAHLRPCCEGCAAHYMICDSDRRFMLRRERLTCPSCYTTRHPVEYFKAFVKIHD